MLYFLAKYVFMSPFIWIFRTPRVIGREHLKNIQGGAIIVSNHWSLQDPIYIATVTPRFIRFMAKKELFATKIGDFMFRRLLLTFPVDRNSADITSLKHAMEMIRQNKIFGIFAEGRRSVSGQMDSFEKGAAFIALKTDAPIIPVYSKPFSWKLRMAVGEPMYAKQICAQYKGKPVEVVTEAISDKLHELKLISEADEA